MVQRQKSTEVMMVYRKKKAMTDGSSSENSGRATPEAHESPVATWYIVKIA